MFCYKRRFFKVRIADYLQDHLIFLDIEATDKNSAITKIVELMDQNDIFMDADKFKTEVFQRESLGSTGIGKGVALPHARTQNVKNIIISITRLKKGIDYDSEDKQPVRLVFLLGTPLKAVGEYLKVLAKLSKLLREDKVRNLILKADTPYQIRKIFEDAED